MAIFEFGSGVLQGVRTDITGATPLNFGLLQDVALDLSFTTKELYGQYQFPVAIARGQGKMTGKAKFAQISGLAFCAFFFGQSLVAGQLATAFGEAHPVPAVSTYTVTATNSATAVDDLGVLYAATGLPFLKVTTLTATGQYTYAAGVYTFYSGDASAAVLINYTYTVSSTGQQLTYANQLLGTTPTFQANLYQTYGNKPVTLKFFNCVSSKLAYATKLEDFTIPEMDFSIFANPAGNVFEWSFPEVS